MKMTKKKIIANIASVLLSIAGLVLSWLFLDSLPRIIVILSVIIFFTLGVLIPLFSVKFPTLYRILLFTLFLLAFVLVMYIILEKTGWLYKLKDIEAIKKVITDSKGWGIVIFFLLTLCQVIFLPIPAAVTMVIGVMIYGDWVAFLISAIGTVIGSVFLFWLGKTFGRKISYWMFGKEKTDKYAKILSDKGKGIFIMIMLFPFFPDDLVCVIAGVTSMSYKFFLIAMTITRTAVIAFTCFFGSGKIIPFSGWGIPVWIAIFAVLVAAMFLVKYFIKKKNKHRSAPILKKFDK